MKPRFLTAFKISILFLWLILLAYGMHYHVFWRDEVRALNIAKAADSIMDLPLFLENEGHPILWYALLKTSYQIFQNNWVLPMLAAVFATLNVLILLYKSPFHWSFALLFVFGQYGLFEYGIVARNYGIAVTLLFTFAMLYRQKKIFWAFIILAIAVQTNFYALIFSLLLAIFIELSTDQAFKGHKHYLGLAILMLSAFFSFLLCTPSPESLVILPFSISQIPFHKIWDVGWGFNNLFDGIWDFKHGFKTFLLLGLLSLFWKRKSALVIAYLGMVFMATFHLSIRPNYSHHEGMFLCFIIVLFWIQPVERNSGTSKQTLSGIQTAGYLLLLITLMFNMIRGFDNYRLYARLDQTNADHLGLWLQENTPENAVYIAEPDYDIEGVMYYQDRPFYLPRESKFGTYALFTTANQSRLSLNRLMQLSDSFQGLGKAPYLITQWDLEKTVDTLYYSYEKYFEIDSSAYRKFNRTFEKVADFHEYISTDEYFFVYQPRKL